MRLKDTLPDAEWQERKATWKAVLLSVPVTFSEIPVQDVWKAAFNRRQAVLQEHESLSRTAMQAAMEVAHFKTLVEAQNPSAGKLSAQALSAEFVRLGLSQVIGGTKQDEEQADGGSLAPTFIRGALNVHKTVMSQPRCVELLMDLECKFGTRSCFHNMSKLAVLANKPTSAASRIWILESLHDQLCWTDLKPSEVTRSTMCGDRSHCGLVALFECKQRVLDYIHSDLLPKAGVLDSDRRLLKEASADHSAYRAHSGDGDITWQARLQKSGILCFELIQDLVFDKKFDHGVRQAARSGGAPEQVWEQEPVKEAWEKVKVELAKEAEERKACSMQADDEEIVEDEDVLTVVRKAPTSFALHSPGYWNAVGNQAVRTYVSLVPEPKTIQGVESAVAQSSLKDIFGSQGVSSVLLWLDLDSVGESQGPGQQPLLRKKYTMDTNALKKLVQGALMGRGSQKRGQAGAEEATRVVDGDVVMIHNDFSHPGGQREAKSVFRLSTAKKEAEVDSELREVLVIFEDESIRNRKQRVRGSYNSSTCVTVATSTIFTQCLPEKAYEHHPGHCFSNVLCNVKALRASEAWHLSRNEKEEVVGKDRVVTITEDAAAKKAESGGSELLESVFSAAALPVPFYQDLIRGHAAKAVLDLAAGAGNFAKAALLERVPYYAFTLTECHSKKLEVILTQFLVDEMRKEGSTHFRPEAVQDQERQEADSVPKKRTKGGKKDEGSEVVPKKKAKAKAKNKKDDDDEEKKEEQGAEEEEAGGSPLPW